MEKQYPPQDMAPPYAYNPTAGPSRTPYPQPLPQQFQVSLQSRI